MLDYRLKELTQILRAEVRGSYADLRITGVSTDSRGARAGELFFAVKGETFDGHDFVSAALEAGAVAAVVDRRRLNELSGTGPLLGVDDPQAALGAWGAHHRSRFSLRVIGVTGSLGKTTTKDLIAAVLSQRYETLANEASLNAEIGLPLTLLRLGSQHEAAVLEMAMRGKGQIRELAEMAQPELGVITNIGMSHMELLGSQQAIVEAKAELLEALPPEGVAFLPADDDFLPLLRERAPSAITFGFNSDADVRGELLPPAEGRLGARFRLHAKRWLDEPLEARIPLLGRHNVLNALAAAAVGLYMDVPSEALLAGLAAAATSAMRMEVHERADGSVILNDAYNASSPVAMQAALDVMVEQRGRRRAVAVLGDMLELGPASEEAHQQVGRATAAAAPDLLVTVGSRAAGIAQAARESGLSGDRIIACEDNNAALAELRRRLRPGDLLLVKGSRGMAMENLVRGLLDDH